MGKILHLGKDPWAKVVVPLPPEDAPPAQLFEFAALATFSQMVAGHLDFRDTVRRTTKAYADKWLPDLKLPPL